MKIKSYCNIGIKNLFRDKKNIIEILLIGLIFSLIIFCMSFRKSLNSYWSDSVKKLIDYRTYIIDFDISKYNIDEAKIKLKNYNHVIEVFEQSSYLISMNIKDNFILSNITDNKVKNSSIYLIGTIPNPIKLIYGSNLDSVDKGKRPIICANQIYPYSENTQNDYLVSKSIDITKKLGEDINLSFINSDEIESFQLVGLYDAKSNHADGTTCYTTLDVVYDLNKKYQNDVFFNENEIVDYLYIIIDDVDNQDIVLDEIRKDGFDIITPILHINKSMGNSVNNLILVISILIIFVSFLIIMYISTKKINKRKIDFSIMKSSGYSNNEIIFIYIFELILEFIFAILLSIIIYVVITFFFQNMYVSNKIMFYDLQIRPSIIAILIDILLSLLIIFILCLVLGKKMNSKYVTKLIK